MIDQSLSSTVEALDVLLDDRFLRHEAHVWLLNGNAYRLGIVAVIFLALQERLHILWRDNLHSVPLSLKMPLPVKGTRASFDADQARWHSLGHLQQLIAHHAPSQGNLTIGAHAMKLEHVLGDINSQNRNVCHDNLLRWRDQFDCGVGEQSIPLIGAKNTRA
jgi:hypothetical protein